MTTIIILNPMGTDVTPFVTGAPLVPQLLKGTIRKPGDTIVTIPYTNQPGRQNVADGVEMLHAAILNAISNGATDILVFGYSEGCQIADWWLWKYGQSTPVDPALIRFWLIANANRKYGGFVCGHPIFDAVGYTNGKPPNTPYRVIDFTRQYDGVSDFPTAQPIQNALVGLQSVGSDQNALSGAMNAVAAVLADTVHKTAALNAISGLVLIHNIYLYVTLDDPNNVSLTEGNITWVWSPTYPAPMLGLSTSFASADRENRLLIEQAYQRPVAIPMPNYASGPGWGQPGGPARPAAPVTGWWSPVKASRGKGAGSYAFTGLGATGSRAPRAAAAAAYVFAGAAVGRRVARAVAAGGAYGFAGGPAVGDDNRREATASGAYNFAGTAVGMSSQGKGSAAGIYNFAGGPASGRRQPKATAPGAYSFGGAAIGRRAPRAAAAGAYLFAGSAVGRRIARAVAAGAYTFASSAIGKVTRRGSASGGYNFAGSAVGFRPSTFQPFTEVNANKTGTTPVGCAGVWVTIMAPAGGAGKGYYTMAAVGRGGGGGGGGGAKIFRVFIPVALLGTNYSINWSAAAATQTDGATIVFTSGSVVLTAVGGKKGADGGSGVGGNGGVGGTWSAAGVPGVTVTGANGAAGGKGAPDNNSVGSPGGNNPDGGGPGGGGGSGLGAFGGTNTSGKGGNSATANGGAAATALNNGNNGAAGSNEDAGGGGSGGSALNGNYSGTGGDGGTPGAGGGGSSGCAAGSPANGGKGGAAATRLEWVATAP